MQHNEKLNAYTYIYYKEEQIGKTIDSDDFIVWVFGLLFVGCLYLQENIQLISIISFFLIIGLIGIAVMYINSLNAKITTEVNDYGIFVSYLQSKDFVNFESILKNQIVDFIDKKIISARDRYHLKNSASSFIDNDRFYLRNSAPSRKSVQYQGFYKENDSYIFTTIYRKLGTGGVLFTSTKPEKYGKMMRALLIGSEDPEKLVDIVNEVMEKKGYGRRQLETEKIQKDVKI